MKQSKVIGILGGGQLAKMLCDSAKKMNHRTVILDPNSDSCGNLSSDYHIVTDYTDEKGLKELCEMSDVITYEFENVPNEVIEFIEKNEGNIPQGKKPLYLSQHRIREKSEMKNIGVKTANFKEVLTKDNLKEAVEEIGIPCILKTSSGGYDGKGQWKIISKIDIENIELEENKEYILEKMINFDLEVSCLVVRSLNGEVATFPVGENIHKDGILHQTIVPARIEKKLRKEIEDISKNIVKKLDIYGPLAIEYFIKGDEIYFNEMAPRPHNSTHYTMDACNYSQFDLHLLSILGEKFPKIELKDCVVMLNVLGEDLDKLEKIKNSNLKNKNIHIYGKIDWKKGRKMAHINFCGNNIEELLDKVNSF